MRRDSWHYMYSNVEPKDSPCCLFLPRLEAKSVAKSLLAKYLEYHGQSPDPDATAFEKIRLEEGGNRGRMRQSTHVCKLKTLVDLIESKDINRLRRWLSILYVVVVTTSSSNEYMTVRGSRFKISSLIVIQKGNHVMYIGQVYAQVGVSFLLSNRLDSPHSPLRQTDGDQRIK